MPPSELKPSYMKSNQVSVTGVMSLSLTHHMSHMNYSVELKDSNQSVTSDVEPPETQCCCKKNTNQTSFVLPLPSASVTPVAQCSASRNFLTDCKGE